MTMALGRMGDVVEVYGYLAAGFLNSLSPLLSVVAARRIEAMPRFQA